MERQPPRSTSDEIDLYIRTYESLLRSSGEVRVRAFEESHLYSESSLHAQARSPVPDTAAFGYAAARLPDCMPQVRRIVIGQSHEQFEAVDLNVREWQRVRTRGRRRPLRWDGAGTLAVFATSISDIDDLVPICTAWQIEWNKLHVLLRDTPVSQSWSSPDLTDADVDWAAVAKTASLDAAEVDKLRSALGARPLSGLRALGRESCDLSVRLLNGTFSEYQRAAQRWWGGIEPQYLRPSHPRRPPVYFVSSNSHSLNNLLGGYARAHRDRIVAFARTANPEDLARPLQEALDQGREDEVDNLTYYLLRNYLHASGSGNLLDHVQAFDRESGIMSIESPGHIDVSAQVIALSELQSGRVDPRVRMPGFEALSDSDAVIVNIDYPLGMAAYHHLSRLGQGVGEVRGVYVMGKAATLNARVGDVMLSGVVHDEHSQNTFLLRNCFSAASVQPYLRWGTVLDNQKALTVRSAFLQNRDYMHAFYSRGYTVLEMEAGPYLAAIYEMCRAGRHPNNELVQLSTDAPFDVGILHYASDTPYSRRQSLLSKSLSYFGVESTYACSIAITRRILESEIARLRA